jgi:hypothetical protein
MTENEKIFENVFGFRVPYSTVFLSMSIKSFDIEQFENSLKEKDDLYNPDNCYHLDMGTVSLFDYIYQKYGEAATNLIEELI